MPLQAQQIQCLQWCFPRVSKSSHTNHPLPSLSRGGHPQQITPYGKSRTAKYSRGSQAGFPPSFTQGHPAVMGCPPPSAPALCIFPCSPEVAETWLDQCLQALSAPQLTGHGVA